MDYVARIVKIYVVTGSSFKYLIIQISSDEAEKNNGEDLSL